MNQVRASDNKLLITPPGSPFTGYHRHGIPDHIIVFSDSDSYERSSNSIDNDSILNEFIQDPNFSNIPILERMPYFDIPPSNNVQIDIQPILINRYYALEFVACTFISIGISSTIFMLNILSVETNTNHPLFYYILSKTIQFFIAGLVIYLFSNADSYKSINVSIDFLVINWSLYDYNIWMVLKYLLIQISACIFGTLLTIGLHYNILLSIPKDVLLNSIILINKDYLLSPSYFLLSIFIHIITVIGLTIIIDCTNSINYHEKIIQKIIYIYSISMLYCTIIGPIGFMIYRTTLYILISFIFNIQKHESVAIIIIMASHMVIKLLTYPFIAFHVKFVWKNSIRRYLEY